eukprot:scaffold18932_cov65-Phaeocystis_antarctica.AAC.16
MARTTIAHHSKTLPPLTPPPASSCVRLPPSYLKYYLLTPAYLPYPSSLAGHIGDQPPVALSGPCAHRARGSSARASPGTSYWRAAACAG